MLLTAAAAMLLLAGCGGGGGGGDHPATCSPGGTQLEISAKSVAFDKDCLAAPANQPFTITFHNDDAGTPHNVVIMTSMDGSTLFKGTIVSGITTASYKVQPLKPGTYHFHCEIHPDTMQGTFVVT